VSPQPSEHKCNVTGRIRISVPDRAWCMLQCRTEGEMRMRVPMHYVRRARVSDPSSLLPSSSPPRHHRLNILHSSSSLPQALRLLLPNPHPFVITSVTYRPRCLRTSFPGAACFPVQPVRLRMQPPRPLSETVAGGWLESRIDRVAERLVICKGI